MEKLEKVHVQRIPGIAVYHSLHHRDAPLRACVSEGFTIWAIRRGVNEVCIDGKRGRADQSSLQLTNPGEVLRILGRHDQQTQDVYVQLFPEEVLPDGASSGVPMVLRTVRSPFVTDRKLRHLVTGLSSVAPLTTEIADELLLYLLEHYQEKPGAAKAFVGRRDLRRIRRLLWDNCGESNTLEEIAGGLGVSRFHLVRSFKAAFHVSPHQYLLMCRAAKARQLVLRGFPLHWVAAELGYADQSHFTREFKKSCGLAPGAFRQTLVSSLEVIPDREA